MTITPSSPPRPYGAPLPWWPLVAVLVADAAVFTVSFSGWGTGTDGWLRATRYTARLSFFVFLVPYLASSLAYWMPGGFTRRIRARRRILGLSFALAHFIHLGAIVTYLRMAGEALSLTALLIGGPAYVFLALMTLTSNDWSMRTLGPRLWARLHWIGIHDLWLVFFLTYASRVAREVPPEARGIYIVLMSIAVAALGLRIATATRRRRR